MKNRRVSFEAPNGSSLRVSLSKNRKGEFKTMVRHRDAEEGRARIGCKNYFESSQEDAAAASFEQLVADAQSRGWSEVSKSRRQREAFNQIPDAPLLAELRAAAAAVGAEPIATASAKPRRK